MNGRARRAATLAVALAALSAASCAEKIATVDPGFTVPEGAASSRARLVVWREIPNHLYVFDRRSPDADPPIPDVLVDSITVETGITGQVHGAIVDGTEANAYQVYRREPNGGYREAYDFAAVPARRWIDRGWEVYHFTDADTVVPTRTYRGRGIVAGAATLSSPLTGEANNTLRSVPNITYTGGTGLNSRGEPVPLDSLFTMQWNSVPNAAGYHIHVYQPSFNLIQLPEQIASGMPAPLYIGKSRDVLVAYLPARNPPPASVSFRMPTPDVAPSDTVMTVRQTRYGQEYLVRIAAVDASGQLIGFTYGSWSQQINDLPGGITLPNSQYAVYFLGAVKVVPSRSTTAPARANRVEPWRR